MTIRSTVILSLLVFLLVSKGVGLEEIQELPHNHSESSSCLYQPGYHFYLFGLALIVSFIYNGHSA